MLDSVSLEHMKELTARRRLIEESINETSCITEATAREMSGGLTSRSQQVKICSSSWIINLVRVPLLVGLVRARCCYLFPN